MKVGKILLYVLLGLQVLFFFNMLTIFFNPNVKDLDFQNGNGCFYANTMFPINALHGKGLSAQEAIAEAQSKVNPYIIVSVVPLILSVAAIFSKQKMLFCVLFVLSLLGSIIIMCTL